VNESTNQANNERMLEQTNQPTIQITDRLDNWLVS